jgi:hypothetical protein
MSDQKAHLYEPAGGYVTVEKFDKLTDRVGKLEKWIWFVSGAAAVVSYLLGASGVVQKLLQ